jgi:hypothetical protein
MTDHYTFPNLPLNPVAPGTNLLVAGPVMGGVRRFVLEMLAARDDRDEGRLLVTTDRNGARALDDYRAVGGEMNDARLAVIDCASGSAGEAGVTVRSLESPGDLTGMGIQFSSLYQQFHGWGVERVRVGVCTLSPVVVYAEDVRDVFRFVHTMTGRIRTTNGLGVFAIDPESQDDQTLASIAQAFDGRIDLRADDGPTVRVTGLPDQPEDWQSVADV